MKIKICGITNIDDAKYCVALGADALGFIFYKKSKRYIEPSIAKKIIAKLPPFISKVGVFVNEEASVINRIAKEIKLSLIQLHGEESMDYISNIDYPIIKAFHVDDNFDFSQLENYKNCYHLLDTYSQKEYGGTGVQFNWEKIPKNIRNKIILAGGVSEENIELIYKTVQPYAIDLSSSVEIQPGIKDRNKLNDLFKKFNDLRKT
ncbi:MAG: phosphoribosylanthranilate isomerase [Melioribacteraceae bacterium]|nr:phosphoribosylanthranilate isomerase [Melioribacteraceae bacterium]